MDESDKSKETDAFTTNGRNNPTAKSESVTNLRKRNQRMKILIILLGVLIVVLLVAIIVIAVTFFKDDKKDEEEKDADVCHTEDCLKTAKYLYENMDLTVDPCDDFYNYTCRGWGLQHPRPEGEIQWGVNTLVSKDLNAKIRAILEYKGKEKVPAAVHKARNFYAACTNVEFRDEYGREMLNKVLKKIGGVPLLSNDWKEDNYDWETAYVYCDLNLNSMQSFFEYKVTRNDPNDLKNVITLKMPEAFFIAPNFEGENKTVDAIQEKKFRDGVFETIKDLKSDLNNDTIERDLTDFINFEKRLYALSSESSETDDSDSLGKMDLPILDKDTEGV